MTNKEEIFEIIQNHPEGLDDDDISELTGITPRQQVQQLCQQLALNRRIRRETVDKAGKRRKIHNFPVRHSEMPQQTAAAVPEQEPWRRRLAALVAATGQSEVQLLEQALQLLALKVLKAHDES